MTSLETRPCSVCAARRLSPRVRVRPGRLQCRWQRSEPLRLQRVPEAWPPPPPLPLSSQHRSEVAETVVNSSLEFMTSFPACSSLTDHQAKQEAHAALSR